MAEAPLQVRKVTTPGCCRVNLGHSHSHRVIKGHGGSIHHTSSEDCPGQMQSQDRSDLAELREECHFPRKKKNTNEIHHHQKYPIPLSRSANPIVSAQTGPIHTAAEGSGKAAHFPEQREKLPPLCGPQQPAVGQRGTLARTAAAATSEDQNHGCSNR